MTRPYMRMSGVLALLVCALLVNLSWIQVLDADALRQRSGNTRSVLEQFNRQRGPIIVGSNPIAASTRAGSDGFYQRSYTDGPLYSAVTGYYSLLYGATGIERSENAVLGGSDSRLFVDRIQQLFAGRARAGGAVILTIDAAAQRAAFTALAGQRGALVAIDARTGAVLALVSQPAFDPQVLAPNDPEQVRGAYAKLTDDPARPLENRAIGSAYPLGSPFEVVTAAAALASGRFSSTTAVQAGPLFNAAGTSVRNAKAKPCNRAQVTLAVALQKGCATAFAWLGSQLGTDALRSTTEQFGFDTTPMAQTAVTASRFPADAQQVAALAALGEGGVTATVLQLAMIAAAVANDGTVMNPYLVRDVRARNLTSIEQAVPTVRGTPLSKVGAKTLQEMLLGIDGVSDCADCKLGAYDVHARTGSPRSGGPSWAMAFAGRIAVAGMVEGSDAGGTAMQAALSVLRVLLVKP